MGSIAVLTPTRERPEQLRAMLDAILDTAAEPERICVYVGWDDDDVTCEWPLGLERADGRSLTLCGQRGPRAQLAEWTNRLAVLALAEGHDILASFGDDHRPRTQGWDLAVRDAFNRMGSGLVYTRDGLQDERLPTAPFFSAEVIRALGFFFPPTLRHMFADNWWLKFARDLGRCTYLPGVLIEHLHPDAPNGNPYDAVNAANDSHYAADEAAYRAFVTSPKYASALARVRAVL